MPCFDAADTTLTLDYAAIAAMPCYVTLTPHMPYAIAGVITPCRHAFAAGYAIRYVALLYIRLRRRHLRQSL